MSTLKISLSVFLSHSHTHTQCWSYWRWRQEWEPCWIRWSKPCLRYAHTHCLSLSFFPRRHTLRSPRERVGQSQSIARVVRAPPLSFSVGLKSTLIDDSFMPQAGRLSHTHTRAHTNIHTHRLCLFSLSAPWRVPRLPLWPQCARNSMGFLNQSVVHLVVKCPQSQTVSWLSQGQNQT